MKVIVTGSEGFIGKALCRTLEARGVEVIGIDRKNGIEAEDIDKVLMLGGISCVYHLAAQTSVFNLDHKAARNSRCGLRRGISGSMLYSFRTHKSSWVLLHQPIFHKK